MKSWIPFFAEESFRDKEREAAALYSILMDEEFKKYQQLKLDYLKKQGIIVALLVVIGLAFVFLQLLPVTVVFLAAIMIFGVLQYRRYKRLEPRRFVELMGKFYWSLSLYPFEDGTVLLDNASFSPSLDMKHHFVDEQGLEEMKDLRKETTELFAEEEILLEPGSDDSPLCGTEKRIGEIFQRAIDMLQNHREEAVDLPVLDTSHSLNHRMPALLRTCLPFRKSDEAQAVFIENLDGKAVYDRFMDWYDYYVRYQKNNLEYKWSGWLDEIKKFMKKHGRMLDRELPADYREEFMRNSLYPGFNHYCPECNQTTEAETDDFRKFPLDENSRMKPTGQDWWQCPVCGHQTTSPLRVSKIYDEVIFPVTQLLVLDDQNKKTAEMNGAEGGVPGTLPADRGKKLYTQVFAVLKEDFDRRLTGEKDQYDRLFRQILTAAETLIRQNRKNRLTGLNEEMEQIWTALLEKRDLLKEKVSRLKIDLCIPEPLHIGVPFYCARYGGSEGGGEFKVILPSKLARKTNADGAVNYELVKDEIYVSYEESAQDKMSASLDRGEIKLDRVKKWSGISSGMKKMKGDFFTDNREDFFDFVEKTHAVVEE